MFRSVTRRLLLVGLLTGCSDAGTGPMFEAGVAVQLTVTGLRPLDPGTEGAYEAWVVSDEGEILSSGRFSVTTAEQSTRRVESPIEHPEYFMLTVEPPGDEDGHPSLHKLLGGRFDGAVAALEMTGYVTVVGIRLEADPGTHVLTTPSDDDARGFPSSEDAGLWLFNPGRDTLDGSYYLDFTLLTEGWWYEGWIVQDYGTSDAVWISYGKFRPDPLRQARARDDTGLGPFSGRRDYKSAMVLELHVPGEDWLANPLGLAVPGGLDLPLDLNGDASLGVPSRWTHVITVEPWGPNREAESTADARPFFLEPYGNPIGEAPPTEPRSIEFHPERLPRGMATLISR